MSRLGRWAAIAVAGVGCWAAGAALGSEKVNVVFILADDLGYGDLGCCGCPDIRTPALDALAKAGVRLTQCYAASPICTPTRCALLTGRYQQRAGPELEAVILPRVKERGLSPKETTIASLLKADGYTTGLVGKWHLGYLDASEPTRHGFQEFYGPRGGEFDYFTHRGRAGDPDFYENTKPVQVEGYATDLFSDRAVSFVKQNKDRPFFLFLSYTAPHYPYQGPNDAKKAFYRRGLTGWGLSTSKKPRKPLSSDIWARGARPTYIQMVERMDQGIGKLLEALDDSGLTGRTLVIFTSDNGGDKLSRNKPLWGNKGTLWEGGIRVPAIMRWPGKLPAGTISDQVAVTMDFSATILAAAGTTPPPERTLDGIDLLPILAGKAKTIERTLFWRRITMGLETTDKAVRKGKWKYLLEKKPEGDNEYLFDLAADVKEQDNLLPDKPEIVKELKQLLAAWEAEMPLQ